MDARAQVADYVSGWGGNPEALKASVQRITRAVTAIMQTLRPEPEHEQERPAAKGRRAA